jgi:hypothetical protein
MKRTIVGITIVVLVGSTFFGAPHRAEAFLGIADVSITHDPIGWLEQAGRWLVERALAVALETLKKRLLDTITDQTIAWIQGGDSPQFISDFGSVFDDAADGALGEVVRQSSLGELCDTRLAARLVLSARRPAPFYRQAQCTLTQVVNNVNAFAQDFQNGSWIAYGTLAEPQNNRFGLKLLAAQETILDTEARQQKAALEAQSTGPFTSTKRCTIWTRVVTDGSGNVEDRLVAGGGNVSSFSGVPWNNNYYNLNTPPPANPGIEISSWQCDPKGIQITDPGTVAQEGANRAVYADIDYIVNSTELTTYLSAILDAVINRLVFEGVNGLRSLTASKTTNPNNGVNSYAGGFTPGAALGQANSAYTAGQQKIFQQSQQALLTEIDHALQYSTADAGVLPGARLEINNIIFAIEDPSAGLVACVGSCSLVYPTLSPPHDINQDYAWMQNVTSTVYAASTTLWQLESGFSSIATTTTALGRLRNWVLSATTVAQLSTSTQPISNANSNHAQVSQFSQFMGSTYTEINRRLLYCAGGTYTDPTTNVSTYIPACTPP